MDFVGGVGFTNIDLLYSGLSRLPLAGEEVYSKGFDMQLGGGVPATMINLRRLGIPSKIITFIGDDCFSRFAKKAFQAYQVELENLYHGHGMPVALSSTIMWENDRSFISYMDEMKITQDDLWEIYQGLKGAKIVDMQMGFLEVYQKLHKEGTLQVLDTGWSDDMSIGKYREYLELADYYVPNQKEALKITGQDTVERAADCLGEFFQDVVIKLDRDGCLLKNKEGMFLIPSMKNVEAVDATGAGDAFLSGFIYGLFHGYPIEQCIRFGNVAGGTCVQGVGCLAKYVNEEELLRLGKKD